MPTSPQQCQDFFPENQVELEAMSVNFCCNFWHVHRLLQGVPEKIAHSLSTTILQPCITELCRFQQNVQKENIYTIKASVWIRPINILCYLAGKWSIWKQSSRLGDTSCFASTLAYSLIVLAVRRYLHGKKSFHPRTKYDLSFIKIRVIPFFKCLHAFNLSVCLLLSVTELQSVETLWAANHSRQSS